MNTSCPACRDAERNPTSGSYRAACSECKARSLANGPLFHAATLAGEITDPYREALQRMFGAEWKAGHARAKAWAQKRDTK